MKLTIQLAEVFLEEPGGVLSIHQVSKRLKIPYGTTYNRIHEMGQLGIVLITPQGKAKLCSLNPENPMTASILAMGSSQSTRTFLTSAASTAHLTGKLRDIIDSHLGDRLHSAILLNFDSFANFSLGIESLENDVPLTQPDGEVSPISLDLFLVLTEEGLTDPRLEMSIQGAFPPHLRPRVSYMTVTGSTLLGMLREKENEAGLAAFHMLRRGLILQGFEKFFALVLKAFPPKLL